MKKFSKYDNTTVRITSKYGDTFTGACQWFPWEYGWSEFGVKEEGLQIGEYILFDTETRIIHKKIRERLYVYRRN